MNEVLYLFSSNIRPLYEQDILNLLGAPVGLTYRFRYKANYVEPAAAGRWSGGLADTPVLIQYSLQQPKQYHEPVFFPIRAGTVRRTFVEGDDLFVVEFTVGRSVGLRSPLGQDPADYAKVVKDWREYQVRAGVGLPYKWSASLGPDAATDEGAPIEVADDDRADTALFERNTRYLSGVASLSAARFFRVLGLYDRRKWVNGDRQPVVLDEETGAFPLQSGRAYLLSIIHSQPTEVTATERFVITTDDDVVRLIGNSSFEVASRYDLVSVPIHAIQLDADVARDGVIRIAPEAPSRGPDVIIPVRNEQGGARTAAILATSIAGLVLLGLPAILTTADSPVRIGLLTLGVAVAVFGPALLRGRLGVAR
jgi:hypothetical protein